MRRRLTAAALALLVAAMLGGSASSCRVDATAIEGTFLWTTLDGKAAPVEFPAGSGARLVGGSLELRDVTAAPAGGEGRYVLTFNVAAGGDSARASITRGRFIARADSLHFTPEGREDRPPVRFTYTLVDEGALELTDTKGHVWHFERERSR